MGVENSVVEHKGCFVYHYTNTQKPIELKVVIISKLKEAIAWHFTRVKEKLCYKIVIRYYKFILTLFKRLFFNF